jgi:hypothetical protein
MTNRTGNLYVVPVINTMGPVVDPSRDDLLASWSDVDAAVSKIFNESYRAKIKDCGNNPSKFSWFIVSWSGFKENPVSRDFGYFNIYDHYMDLWNDKMRSYGDEIYWMYNHPAASKVGNEWGLDWLENSQYLEILMRFIYERNFFPSVVQVVTEANDASNFLENYFPFDLSNRNSIDVNWEALNADGKPMWQVIDWRNAPSTWDVYHPSKDSYQNKGDMQRVIGRLLDIKTVVYDFKEYEIEAAFEQCMKGKNQMISAYEHDFRDRADVIQEKFLFPLEKISKKYPSVNWYYANSKTAFNAMLNSSPSYAAKFSISRDSHNNILIHSNNKIFSNNPFVFFVKNSKYNFIVPLKCGEHSWLLHNSASCVDAELIIVANSTSGQSDIHRFKC